MKNKQIKCGKNIPVLCSTLWQKYFLDHALKRKKKCDQPHQWHPLSTELACLVKLTLVYKLIQVKTVPTKTDCNKRMELPWGFLSQYIHRGANIWLVLAGRYVCVPLGCQRGVWMGYKGSWQNVYEMVIRLRVEYDHRWTHLLLVTFVAVTFSVWSSADGILKCLVLVFLVHWETSVPDCLTRLALREIIFHSWLSVDNAVWIAFAHFFASVPSS